MNRRPAINPRLLAFIRAHQPFVSSRAGSPGQGAANGAAVSQAHGTEAPAVETTLGRGAIPPADHFARPSVHFGAAQLAAEGV